VLVDRWLAIGQHSRLPPEETTVSDLFPAPPMLAAFVVASLILAVTPGPGVLYIVTRSVIQGRRSGLASVAGVALGNLGNAIGASLGLAALFAVSSLAFAVVKYAGAAYLVYLGVQAIRRPAPAKGASSRAPEGAPASPTAGKLGRIFRDGFLVALLNPKTAVFFAAFLPQFMRLDSAGVLQSVVLGALFVAIAAVTDTVYALAAGAVAPLLGRARGVRAMGRYATGGAFVGLGLFTAIAGERGR
jgi:threonine/homoserine/homoserine lactone efflux protein